MVCTTLPYLDENTTIQALNTPRVTTAPPPSVSRRDMQLGQSFQHAVLGLLLVITSVSASKTSYSLIHYSVKLKGNQWLSYSVCLKCLLCYENDWLHNLNCVKFYSFTCIWNLDLEVFSCQAENNIGRGQHSLTNVLFKWELSFVVISTRLKMWNV